MPVPLRISESGDAIDSHHTSQYSVYMSILVHMNIYSHIYYVQYMQRKQDIGNGYPVPASRGLLT